jgi:type I restriction enzyme S subunit
MSSKFLSEVADIVRGIAFPKDDKSYVQRPGDVACLRTTNVQRQVEWGDLWFVPAKHVKRDDQNVRSGDILISTANSYELVGKVAQVAELPTPATLGAFISLIRPKEGVHPKFLYHQLAWGKTQTRIREMSSNTTNISNVSTKKLATLELSVPSFDEQTLIVAELEKQFSRVDEAVANLQRVKANLKRYKAAILKAAVEGRLVETEGAAKGLHDHSNWVPIGNVIQSLDQGWSPKCENEPRSSDLQWAVMKTTAVQPMQFLVEENKRLTPELIPREYLELVDGDLLITRAGPRNRVGITCLVRASAYRLMLCDKAYRLRAKLDEALPAYLEVALNSPTLLDSLDEMKSGISDSGLNLTQKRFAELCIPLPSRAEQARIVAEVDRHLSIAREVESEVDTNLQRAQALRQSVLSSAFSRS